MVVAAYAIAFLLLVYSYDAGLFHYIPGRDLLGTPEYGNFAVAFFVVLVYSTFSPDKFQKPSDFLLHLQFLFPILPMLALYARSGLPGEYLVLVLTSYSVLAAIARVNIKSVRILCLSPRLVMTAAVVLTFVALSFMLAKGGHEYFNLNIAKVYEFRELAASNLPAFFGYVNHLVARVLVPFALVLAIVYRSRLIIMLSILGSVLVYGLTAHKSFIFYPLAVLGIYYLTKERNAVGLMLVAYVALLILSIAGDIIGGAWTWIGALFLERLCFIPALINFYFFGFFSDAANQYVFWSDSKLTFRLLEYPYDLDVPHLIGREFFFDEKIAANTGWIGAGYAQLGPAGMLIYALIIGTLLSLLNAYARVMGEGFVLAATFPPMLAVLLSADLPTALLTSGVIWALLILSITVPRRSWSLSAYLRGRVSSKR